MWFHFLHLLHRSGVLFLSGQGTTGLGFISSAIVSVCSFVITAVLILWVRGKDAVMQHWGPNIGIAFAGAILGNLLYYGSIFGSDVVKTVYNDHLYLTSALESAQSERGQWVAKYNDQQQQVKKMRATGTKTEYVSVPCPTPIQSHTYSPGVPPTQLDKLIEINQRLSSTDRSRLSDALFAYGTFLEEANRVFGKANTELGPLAGAFQSGAIITSLDTHKKTLQEIIDSVEDLQKRFNAVRKQWNYYEAQTSYIFGDNDNLGPIAIENAASDYLAFLNNWSVIQNKNNKQVLTLYFAEQLRAEDFLGIFSHWWTASRERLQQMKQSFQ